MLSLLEQLHSPTPSDLNVKCKAGVNPLAFGKEVSIRQNNECCLCAERHEASPACLDKLTEIE